MSAGPQIRRLRDGRLHLHHGPIDMLLQLEGSLQAVAAAEARAAARFDGLLAELAAELPQLRAPLQAQAPCPLRGPVARRMWQAARAAAGTAFVTPMAAVAGAGAEAVLAAICPPPAAPAAPTSADAAGARAAAGAPAGPAVAALAGGALAHTAPADAAPADAALGGAASARVAPVKAAPADAAPVGDDAAGGGPVAAAPGGGAPAAAGTGASGAPAPGAPFLRGSAAGDGGGLRRASINNGGDIALWLAPGAPAWRLGVVVCPSRPASPGWLEIGPDSPCRGVATSGAPGRSLSLGIADSVTVLAVAAPEADAAATLIASAVDLPGDPAVTRRPARQLQPDSDLGDRPVTVAVGPLSPPRIARALEAGAAVAEALVARGTILGALLALGAQVRIVGDVPLRPPPGGAALSLSPAGALADV